ncbi:ELKS/Rab6-interacting/CAST family member 1-like isoform X1 [Ciona intestinalis]
MMSSSDGNKLHVNGEDDRGSLRSSGGDFILQLQQDLESLRREIDIKESKLQSNMNSIKTFWSPELKKERALRKEERNQIVTLKEQLKVTQEENQHLHLTTQALQDELRAQRDLNQLLHEDFVTSPSDVGDKESTRIMQDNYERLLRENELLQSTMEELESRIEAQRQTLGTRDESVRKLLEMLQCKGLPKSDDEGLNVEVDSMKAQIIGYQSRLGHMENMLHDKNIEVQQYKNRCLDGNEETSTIHKVIDAKEAKISSLERMNREVELELESTKHEADIIMRQHREDVKQLEAVKSHTDFMKNKVDQLKSDVQKKETEIVTLQTRLDTLNNQQSDNRQHIDVLKESLNAKDQRAAVLQSEVDSLRNRLDEKQRILDEKQDYLLRLQEDKSCDASELSHLRDTLDVKDRKILVLHKKIESLSEVVRERDGMLEEKKRALVALEEDSCTSDSALTTMEEALADKDKIVEALQHEVSLLRQQLRDESADLDQQLKNAEQQLDCLRRDVTEKETSLSELQEQATSLASSIVKKDSFIKQLEINIQKHTEDFNRLQNQHKKAQQQAMTDATKEDFNSKIRNLEMEVQTKVDEASRCQGDLDRLLGILKETENEKHSKDEKISAMEKKHKEQTTKIKSLQTEMIEDARRKGAAQDRDVAKYLSEIKAKDERVEELEEALRESVSITAEREGVLAGVEEGRRVAENQLAELVAEFTKTKQVLEETGMRVASMEVMVASKDRMLGKMRGERRKQLEEALEMKQEALLAAISEKDSNIALLELSQPRKKSNADEVCMLRREKDALVQQLKQQTQNRLKLMQEDSDVASDAKHSDAKRKTRNNEEDGIWA